MSRSSLRIAGLILALALVVTACGSSGGGSEGASGSTSNVKLSDLTGKTIGVQSNTTGETYANEHKPEGATIKSFGGTDELFGALSSGQIDAILQDFPINAYRATKDKSVEVAETFKTKEQYGFVVKKGNDKLLAAINFGLGAARTNGTYDALYKKYFGRDPEGKAPKPTGGDSTGMTTIKPGTLTMCSDIPYAPMEFESTDGSGASGYTGFDVELMKAIAKSSAFELAVIDVDFDGILGNLAANKCDVVASSVTITDERKKGADFSDPYFDADQSLLVKK